ncbi:hypothetical protein BDEG_28132 [Batrachochytrium dendrobatidis JEL423]|uniref:Uncharacterized protein n=1 Tax=Batrachochytrium dendrobatidis (strain JEL423) TaxID=403673 RepID=A0A177WXX8_BATDL|nr:hypothetical protein BDEG_28132 [Batrachochytrium dendrobatidis JEL423]
MQVYQESTLVQQNSKTSSMIVEMTRCQKKHHSKPREHAESKTNIVEILENGSHYHFYNINSVHLPVSCSNYPENKRSRKQVIVNVPACSIQKVTSAANLGI